MGSPPSQFRVLQSLKHDVLFASTLNRLLFILHSFSYWISSMTLCFSFSFHVTLSSLSPDPQPPALVPPRFSHHKALSALKQHPLPSFLITPPSSLHAIKCQFLWGLPFYSLTSLPFFPLLCLFISLAHTALVLCKGLQSGFPHFYLSPLQSVLTTAAFMGSPPPAPHLRLPNKASLSPAWLLNILRTKAVSKAGGYDLVCVG